MTLLLKLKDLCYYDYKAEVVWVLNKFSYKERKLKERMQSLRDRGEL